MSRMKSLTAALVATVVLTVGCSEAETTVPSTGGTGEAADGSTETARKPLGEPVVNESVTKVSTYELSVPNMDCPYGCYPTVAKSLSELPDVAGVRLADPEDAQDGEIADRRVFVDVGEGFDLDAALAALEKKAYPATAKAVDGASDAAADGDAADPAEPPAAG